MNRQTQRNRFGCNFKIELIDPKKSNEPPYFQDSPTITSKKYCYV